jgi:hypothetical protein
VQGSAHLILNACTLLVRVGYMVDASGKLARLELEFGLSPSARKYLTSNWREMMAKNQT